MGSLFSPPRPPALPPLPPAAAPTPSPDELERRRRLDAVARRQRGRQGTIVTTPRGLLRLSADLPARKSLLGE